ncbi:hypothetical protein [Paraburkholderia tagetis]|uniref:Uncharacterized protein n=1 Tax=Paraburkholderia tagetis TaxID=2913261 RepID=A0A9X1RPB1_9BURK|nr:hypothetical protein [Paraburkholderia tagetis]MCG5075841.1 hypothetical protein [Paraburkholderia tagetis]
MTRRTRNPDGTLTLKSFSYFGPEEHAEEAFRRELAEIEEHNREALAEWNHLAPEERERRTREFEAREAKFHASTAQWESLPFNPQIERSEIPTFL